LHSRRKERKQNYWGCLGRWDEATNVTSTLPDFLLCFYSPLTHPLPSLSALLSARSDQESQLARGAAEEARRADLVLELSEDSSAASVTPAYLKEGKESEREERGRRTVPHGWQQKEQSVFPAESAPGDIQV
jgi:hypothetical protein